MYNYAIFHSPETSHNVNKFSNIYATTFRDGFKIYGTEMQLLPSLKVILKRKVVCKALTFETKITHNLTDWVIP
jgi:hypothetical protein